MANNVLNREELRTNNATMFVNPNFYCSSLPALMGIIYNPPSIINHYWNRKTEHVTWSFLGLSVNFPVHRQNSLLMEDICKDCTYTVCGRLPVHTYTPRECKLSNGKPCQECVHWQMAKLDSQISQLHSQLVQLTHNRHVLITKINQRHEPFIHRLPLSVSSQIFEEYVHQVHSDFDPKEASDSTHVKDWSPALFLSSICATWRRIAFATSEIWRFINIPLREDNPDVYLKLKLLDECVERSCQRTLFIGVFQFQLYEDPHFYRLKEKLDKLGFLYEAIKKTAWGAEEITLWGLPTPALQRIIPTNTPNLTMVRIAEYGRGFSWDLTTVTSPSLARYSEILILDMDRSTCSISVKLIGTPSRL